MSRSTRHARPAREHPRVVVTCAYVDPVTEADRLRAQLRLRLRLRISPLGKDPHPGAIAPFVVVELDEPHGSPGRATSARFRSLAGDPPALRAFTRKVLGRQWGR